MNRRKHRKHTQIEKLKTVDWKRKIRMTLPLLGFMVIYMIWFETLETTPAAHYHIIYCSLDSWIPFCQYFIVPYLLWFAFVPAMMGYMLLQDEDVFRQQSFALMAGMLIFLIVSTVYPTMISLRPLTMPNDGIFCQLVQRLYASDTPTNVTPSIHVYNTLTVLTGFYMCHGKISRSRNWRIGVTSLSVLIIMSTVLLKQHSILDLIAAGFMFAAVHAVIRLFYAGRSGRRNTAGIPAPSYSRQDAYQPYQRTRK